MKYKGENRKWISVNDLVVVQRDDKPYLIRHTLLSIWKYFSVKYHKIMQSDGMCAHDHPWSFLTIILKGGYFEWTPETQKEKGKILQERIGIDGEIEVKRWHGAGSVMYRPANWRHSLELKIPVDYYQLVTNGKLMEDPIVAHTLVFTFKESKDWGFFTSFGWIFWRDYNEGEDC